MQWQLSAQARLRSDAPSQCARCAVLQASLQPCCFMTQMLSCCYDAQYLISASFTACSSVQIGKSAFTSPSIAFLVLQGERRRTGKTDRRSTELSTVIRNCLEQTILLELMPSSQIDVFVQVLQVSHPALAHVWTV